MFSIVTCVEFVKVHDPDSLFAAAAEAGVPFMETAMGMEFRDDGPYLRTEITRRIPKASPGRFKGVPMDTPEAREGRILNLACQYAAIPAAFDDSIECDYSPLDD